MSDLVVVSYKGEETADQVLNKLQQMQKEHLIDLEDACVVIHDKKGKVHLKQAVDLVKISAPKARYLDASLEDRSPRSSARAGH